MIWRRRRGNGGEGQEEEGEEKMQEREWGEGQRADGEREGEKLPLDIEKVSIWQESAKGDQRLCF